MASYIHCDRCGRKDPCYPGERFEYYNCHACEQDYQISLWRGNYCGERGWTDYAVAAWNEMFLEQHGMTYEEHAQQHAEYRNAVT